MRQYHDGHFPLRSCRARARMIRRTEMVRYYIAIAVLLASERLKPFPWIDLNSPEAT